MNTFGTIFRLTTFGESHGRAVGGVVDGCPAGLKIDKDLLVYDLARRRGDTSLTTSRRELDDVQWLSGLRDGITLGTPLAFCIENGDIDDDAYMPLSDCYRPGHADYTQAQRYGVHEWRGGGRASGRETVSRVVAGTVARQLLSRKEIKVEAVAYTPQSDAAADENRDTYGGVVRCTVTGMPAGIGNPLSGRLNAMLAAAMMSIPSAMAFEMGCGTESASMTGKDFVDQWDADHFPQTPCVTNRCGGVQGGISNGMPITFRVTFHAVSTQSSPMQCITANGKLKEVLLTGRHDRCHVKRLPVIVEAMTAITLVDAMMQQQIVF